MVSIILLLLFFLYYIDIRTLKGAIYLIPKNYKGKLKIYYNLKGYPQLPKEDGYFIIKFPQNGIVKTSSKPLFGKQKDKFYYYDKNESKIEKIKNLHIGGYTVENKGAIIRYIIIGSKGDQ